MSALLSLLVVIAAWIAVTAVRVLPPTVDLWVGRRAGGFARRQLRLTVRNGRSLAFGAWLPGWLETATQPWPVSLDAVRFTLAPPHGLAPEIAGDFDDPPRLEIESGTRVAVRGSELRIDGARVATTGPAEAAWWSHWLAELARSEPNERRAKVATVIASWLDCAEVRRRSDELRRSTSRLGASGWTLLVFLYAALPIAIAARAPVSLTQALVAYVAIVVWCQAEFVLACRRLWPTGWRSRAAHSLLFLVSPADALAATARLSRSHLSLFHPLAIAIALACPEHRAATTSAIARSLRHPKRPPPAEGSAARSAVERLMQQHASASEQVVRPAEADGAAGSWCPHCGAQYVARSGACPDCETVELLPLTGCATAPAVEASRPGRSG